MTRQQAVTEMLKALGQAWRGDWSGFDGRSLRAQLEEIAAFLNAPESDRTVEEGLSTWYVVNGICPSRHHWTRYCDEGC